MGKIEKAIQLAREQRGEQIPDARSQGSEEQSRRLSDSNIGLPVVFQLQDYAKHIPDARHLDRQHIINDRFSEQGLTHYKMLRTRVLQQLKTKDWRTIAITSTERGAGKTVTAINLAITLALNGGHDIYLMDLDLRNPGIAECLGLPDESTGLGCFLDGRVEHDSLLWNVGVDRLKVLPSWGQFTNSSELLTSKKMFDLLRTIRSSAMDPITFIDLPPVLTSDDAIAIAPLVDAFMIVVSEGESKREDVARAFDLLRQSDILGVVLNKSEYF